MDVIKLKKNFEKNSRCKKQDYKHKDELQNWKSDTAFEKWIEKSEEIRPTNQKQS